MKRRAALAVLMVFVLVAGITVQAAEPRAASSTLSLSFDGSTAVCTAYCKGGSTSDNVEATVTLYQGTTYVDSWSNSGKYAVSISEECHVTRGKSYTLKLNYSINGVEQPEKTVSKTCN